MTGVQSPEALASRLPPLTACVLASRSPRRLDLLSLLVPRERIRVLPPSSPDEAGFEGLDDRLAIDARLRAIAAAKCDDVLSRLGPDAPRSIVVAADTVVVVTAPGPPSPHPSLSPSPRPPLAVLGQPPEAAWRETTRRWFLDRYAGRTHSVLTGLCVAAPAGRRESIVETRVTVRPDAADFLDWYLATGEPRGKAGGYAIQGAGSLFVERIEGSLTNVVGLPLEAVLAALRELGFGDDAPFSGR